MQAVEPSPEYRRLLVWAARWSRLHGRLNARLVAAANDRRVDVLEHRTTIDRLSRMCDRALARACKARARAFNVRMGELSRW